jgi:hypothetical protein
MIEALALSREWSAIDVGETLAFPGASARPERQLSMSADQLMRNISALLEDLVLCTIQRRTAADFIATRSETFPKYMETVSALASLVRVVVPPHVIERLNREFFCELEADLRENGLTAFGPALRDQAVFTVWTLRKISDLISQIAANNKTNVKPSDEVAAIMQQLLFHAVWTRFHVNCLITSIKRQEPLYPGVLDVVIDGLRSAVNAFGLTRRLLDILVPTPEIKLEPVEWDEEEEALLNEAKSDMLIELREVV